jgi:Na+/proline symporter
LDRICPKNYPVFQTRKGELKRSHQAADCNVAIPASARLCVPPPGAGAAVAAAIAARTVTATAAVTTTTIMTTMTMKTTMKKKKKNKMKMKMLKSITMPMIAKATSFRHSVFAGAGAGVSGVLAEFDYARIRLLQNLFHAGCAHHFLKE